MKNIILLVTLSALLLVHPVRAQHAIGSMGNSLVGLIATGEYNKDESLYRAKAYIMQRLGVTTQPTRFQAFALAAATSGELTSLVYSSSQDAQKSGLLLTFYGGFVNEQGVRYQAYAFKEFNKAQSEELMAKLDAVLKSAPLELIGDNANLYFSYDDVTFLVYSSASSEPRVRVFWGQFDSEWNAGAIHKTANRMTKKF